jgi:membrane associated rhomboid family serine protease
MLFPLRDTLLTRHRPVMTWSLIVATVGVYVFEALSHPQHLEQIAYLFGIVPARYSHPEWAARIGFPIDDYWPFVTSIFLHAGVLHVASNMWFLRIFGDNVEDRMGPWRFLAFYLICGVIAGVVHWWSNPHSIVPTVGASGAIAGVLGGYIVLYPRARIVALLWLIFWPLTFEISAVFFLFYWFGIQLLNGTAALLGPEQLGGVAWWAHVGGFVAGAALVSAFVTERQIPPLPQQAPAWKTKFDSDPKKYAEPAPRIRNGTRI